MANRSIRTYGFIERQYVHWFLPRITEQQKAGLSAHEIATKFSNRGITTAMSPRLWDAQHVLFVVRKNESIRREDAIRRAEATFKRVKLYNSPLIVGEFVAYDSKPAILKPESHGTDQATSGLPRRAD
jgi:hypothetical protein